MKDAMNKTAYPIKTGATTDLNEIEELDSNVFGRSRMPETIGEKLSLHEDVHITIATNRNKDLVGYGIGYKARNKYYLWRLAVSPDYRGRGIGSRIIDEQIRFAKKKGYTSFFVKTSNRWKDMLRLLLQHEFNIIGFKAHEWGEDPLGSALWLEKTIL